MRRQLNRVYVFIKSLKLKFTFGASSAWRQSRKSHFRLIPFGNLSTKFHLNSHFPLGTPGSKALPGKMVNKRCIRSSRLWDASEYNNRGKRVTDLPAISRSHVSFASLDTEKPVQRFHRTHPFEFTPWLNHFLGFAATVVATLNEADDDQGRSHARMLYA